MPLRKKRFSFYTRRRRLQQRLQQQQEVQQPTEDASPLNAQDNDVLQAQQQEVGMQQNEVRRVPREPRMQRRRRHQDNVPRVIHRLRQEQQFTRRHFRYDNDFDSKPAVQFLAEVTSTAMATSKFPTKPKPAKEVLQYTMQGNQFVHVPKKPGATIIPAIRQGNQLVEKDTEGSLPAIFLTKCKTNAGETTQLCKKVFVLEKGQYVAYYNPLSQAEIAQVFSHSTLVKSINQVSPAPSHAGVISSVSSKGSKYSIPFKMVTVGAVSKPGQTTSKPSTVTLTSTTPVLTNPLSTNAPKPATITTIPSHALNTSKSTLKTTAVKPVCPAAFTVTASTNQTTKPTMVTTSSPRVAGLTAESVINPHIAKAVAQPKVGKAGIESIKIITKPGYASPTFTKASTAQKPTTVTISIPSTVPVLDKPTGTISTGKPTGTGTTSTGKPTGTIKTSKLPDLAPISQILQSVEQTSKTPGKLQIGDNSLSYLALTLPNNSTVTLRKVPGTTNFVVEEVNKDNRHTSYILQHGQASSSTGPSRSQVPLSGGSNPSGQKIPVGKVLPLQMSTPKPNYSVPSSVVKPRLSFVATKTPAQMSPVVLNQAAIASNISKSGLGGTAKPVELPTAFTSLIDKLMGCSAKTTATTSQPEVVKAAPGVSILNNVFQPVQDRRSSKEPDKTEQREVLQPSIKIPQAPRETTLIPMKITAVSDTGDEISFSRDGEDNDKAGNDVTKETTSVSSSELVSSNKSEPVCHSPPPLETNNDGSESASDPAAKETAPPSVTNSNVITPESDPVANKTDEYPILKNIMARVYLASESDKDSTQESSSLKIDSVFSLNEDQKKEFFPDNNNDSTGATVSFELVNVGDKGSSHDAVSNETEDVRIKQVSSETGDVRIKQVSSETEDVRIKQVSSETEDVRIRQVSSETEDVRIGQVSSETEDVCIGQVSSETEDVRIKQVSSETEDVRIKQVSSETEDVLIKQESSENEDVRIGQVSSENEEDVRIKQERPESPNDNQTANESMDVTVKQEPASPPVLFKDEPVDNYHYTNYSVPNDDDSSSSTCSSDNEETDTTVKFTSKKIKTEPVDDASQIKTESTDASNITSSTVPMVTKPPPAAKSSPGVSQKVIKGVTTPNNSPRVASGIPSAAKTPTVAGQNLHGLVKDINGKKYIVVSPSGKILSDSLQPRVPSSARRETAASLGMVGGKSYLVTMSNGDKQLINLPLGSPASSLLSSIAQKNGLSVSKLANDNSVENKSQSYSVVRKNQGYFLVSRHADGQSSSWSTIKSVIPPDKSTTANVDTGSKSTKPKIQMVHSAGLSATLKDTTSKVKSKSAPHASSTIVTAKPASDTNTHIRLARASTTEKPASDTNTQIRLARASTTAKPASETNTQIKLERAIPTTEPESETKPNIRLHDAPRDVCPTLAKEEPTDGRRRSSRERRLKRRYSPPPLGPIRKQRYSPPSQEAVPKWSSCPSDSEDTCSASSEDAKIADVEESEPARLSPAVASRDDRMRLLKDLISKKERVLEEMRKRRKFEKELRETDPDLMDL